ncbi:MAG: hypothetical protein AVDCRST_MAG95-551, partial [uncultured Adhaeribacter sp.]
MMLLTRFVCLIAFLCFTSTSSAGHFPFPVGARAAGLAGAAVTLSDIWAIGNNVAGIAHLKKATVGIFAENRFGMQAFTTVGLQAAYP